MGSRSPLRVRRSGEKTSTSAGFLLQRKSRLNRYLLQGARHTVGKTLYSRARRVGLNGASCLLFGLGVDSSFGLLVVVTAGLLFQPAFELVVLLEKELERFAYDVGWSCIDELGVPVQVVSDFFLQADLKGCSFGCFDGAFRSATFFPPSRF